MGKSQGDGGRGVHGQRRSDRAPQVRQPHEHDTYKRGAKPHGDLVCGECGLVQHAGRWQRAAPPPREARRGLCPACERVRDRYPAGTIRLHAAPGPLRDELLGMIRNLERDESEEHPLERIMGVTGDDACLTVLTTGTHLANRVASALKRRSRGTVEIHRPEEQQLVAVDWRDGA